MGKVEKEMASLTGNEIEVSTESLRRSADNVGPTWSQLHGKINKIKVEMSFCYSPKSLVGAFGRTAMLILKTGVIEDNFTT